MSKSYVPVMSHKGIESLPQSHIFYSIYLSNLMVKTFDISNFDHVIQRNSWFEILKVFKIWLERCKS